MATDDVRFTLVLSAEAHRRLVEAAAQREMSATYIARRAVEDYLDRLIPADELRLTKD